MDYMREFEPDESSKVEAIEDGKIVLVGEDYAKREGLLILRKSASTESKDFEGRKKVEEDITGVRGFGKASFDDFRKPLPGKGNQVASELMDNFHWELLRARRGRGLTRKEAAKELNMSEGDLKMLENGVCNKNDFLMINKLQDYYGINLRRDKVDFNQEMRKLVEEPEEEIEEDRKVNVYGDDIEIID